MNFIRFLTKHVFIWFRKGLLMTNCYAVAREREAKLHLSLKSLKMYSYVVRMQAVNLFFEKSRALMFVYAAAVLALSVVLLIYEDSLRHLLVALVLLLVPFVLAKSLVVITLLGKGMHVADQDLVNFFALRWVPLLWANFVEFSNRHLVAR